LSTVNAAIHATNFTAGFKAVNSTFVSTVDAAFSTTDVAAIDAAVLSAFDAT
jgi:hypothetical protein